MTMQGEPAVEIAMLMVLQTIEDFPLATQMAALKKASELLNLAQREREEQSGALIMADEPSLPALPETIAVLLDTTRDGDNPEFLQAAGLSDACLRYLLAQADTEGQRTQ